MKNLNNQIVKLHDYEFTYLPYSIQNDSWSCGYRILIVIIQKKFYFSMNTSMF